MYKKILVLVFLSLATGLNSNISGFFPDQQGTRTFPFGIPKTHPGEKTVTHTGYSVSYNHAFMQANWVAYELTREKTNGGEERTNKFIPDPMVEGGTATNDDYKKSGYDKGHLAPAVDMSWSPEAMKESFYFSNISPQKPGFNRGIWKKLEEKVRGWAEEYGDIYIVTGPVLKPGLPSIGIHAVAVPEYFYKVVADVHSPGKKGIGFLMENESSSEPLQRFAVTIDSVEKVTGMDFFPQFTEEEEKMIEGRIDPKEWSWSSSKGTGRIGPPLRRNKPCPEVPYSVTTTGK